MNTHVSDCPVIELTKREQRIAIAVGVQRNIQNIWADGFHGDGNDGWTRHIEGAAGEMAIAKMLNRFWNGEVGNKSANDVGPYEVRTCCNHRWGLPIKEKDHNDKPYILVEGKMPKFRVVGWLYARDGKKPEYWKEDAPRPAYFVPQSELQPMSELPAL